MDGPNTLRIVLLGKAGVGKTSLANTIFGKAIFQITGFSDVEPQCSQALTESVNGRNITLIDTPGFFDPDRCEEDMKPELVRCITECAPGPHAFLIVLRVEKFTEHEQAVITQMCQFFSEDALKYAAVVFTQGDQLPEGMKIQDYVAQSEGLSDLVKRCGGRCHVVDNRYWKNNQHVDYRNNQFQVAELLSTIDKIVAQNNGEFFTNDMLQQMEKDIEEEEERIRQTSEDLSQEEVRKQAKSSVFQKQVNKAPQTWFKNLVGGFAVIVLVFAAVWIRSKPKQNLSTMTTASAPLLQVVVPCDEAVKPSSPSPQEPTPKKLIVKTFVAIMDRLNALYERIYNPYNPFQ